ncbi:hypothetical protein PISL3812_04141 [Talaromyces islandicus]|uniref:Fucose-specific lectin n=1 Tax=Talaromyces islandicus TaxID=28573 RepID=A0A0U1LWG0_TALIS|nr:hypothetical protein PISL3812_04141 [Talaromyces islandicus]
MPSSAATIGLALQASGFVFSGEGPLRLATTEIEDDEVMLTDKLIDGDESGDPVFVTSDVKLGSPASYVATQDMIALLSVKPDNILDCHQLNVEDETWDEQPIGNTHPIICHQSSKMTSVTLASGAHVFFQSPNGILVDLQYHQDIKEWTQHSMRITAQEGSPLYATQAFSKVFLFFIGRDNCIYYVARSTDGPMSDWQSTAILPGPRFEHVPDGVLVVPENEPDAFISYILEGSQLSKIDAAGESVKVGTIDENGTFYPTSDQECTIIINIINPYINGGLFGGGGAGGRGGGGGGGGPWGGQRWYY